MFELHYSHPLKVPDDVQLALKSQQRYDSGFPPTLTIDEALGYLVEECQQIPNTGRCTLHSNYDRINSPKLRKKLQDGSAVCLELSVSGQRYYLTSHIWGMIEHNIYALHLTVRAINNIVKWGVADHSQALSGFDAFRSSVATEDGLSAEDLLNKGQWMAILRLSHNATLDEANAAYRKFAKEAAENEEALLRLNQAIEAARAYFAKRK